MAVKALLPKRKDAPKKTGKKGIGPVDTPAKGEALATAATEKAKPKPRQARLAGMEDPVIEELQGAALEYADVRDQRMALSKPEGELKSKLLGLMKKHRKNHYSYNGVEIDVVTEEETVKVRIHKAKKSGVSSEEDSTS